MRGGKKTRNGIPAIESEPAGRPDMTRAANTGTHAHEHAIHGMRGLIHFGPAQDSPVLVQFMSSERSLLLSAQM